MAITKIQQYCPVSDVELADGRALSSRVYRDWARQLNNMKSYACAPMLILNNTYPGGAQTTSGSTNQIYWGKWCGVPFPAPYTGIRVVICARVIAAGDSVTFRMYADTRPYNAADPVLTSNMSANVATGTSSAVTSTTPVVVPAFSVTGFTIGDYIPSVTPRSERKVYLMLSTDPVVSDDIAVIYNIAAWALAL